MPNRPCIPSLKTTMFARAGAIVATAALGGCLSAGVAIGWNASSSVAFADTEATADATLTETTPVLDNPGISESALGGLHTDYLSTSSCQLASALPSALDLRHFGGTVTFSAGDKKSVITGGTNYVSPVKNQTPYGTCWSFASTAASETSMLTALDQADDGELNGTVDYEKAASGELGVRAAAITDLSERHLAYFAFAHPSTTGMYSSQAGEGSYLLTNSTDAKDILNFGGFTQLSMSIYSSGIGPVPESLVPYSSQEGWIEVLGLNADKTETTYKYFTSLEDALAYSEETWTDETIEQYNETHGLALTRSALMPHISKRGNWAVDQSLMFGVVAELDNSNVISVKHNDNGSLAGDSETLMKQELNEGHAIAVTYTSDSTKADAKIPVTNSYINTETWAQYTFDWTTSDHVVTIVGYDDNYDASNFTHTLYKYENGEYVVDEEKTAKTTPAGNGAWICKNSWGSVDNENPLYDGDWGVDGSGYFYLSYYDKSIQGAETFEYDLSEEAQERTDYACYQYDLGNTNSIESLSSDTEYKMCNVFDGPSVGEAAVSIRDLGGLTGTPNVTLSFALYVMDDDADVATALDSDQPAATFTETFDNAGYHRIHLDAGVVVSPGQKFAVVQTCQRANGKYEHNYTYGITNEFALASNSLNLAVGGNNTIKKYYVTKINQGESYAKTGDTWTDWKDLSAQIDANLVKNEIGNNQKSAAMYRNMAENATTEEEKTKYEGYAAAYERFSVSSVRAIDNWTIKAYGDEVEEATTPTVYRLYNPYTSEHLWTTNENEYETLKTYNWTQEGTAWTSPTEGVGVYRLYNPVLSKHLYTTDKNEVAQLTSTQGWVKDNNGNPVFYSAQNAETGEAAADALAVYRLYNGALSQHMLTKSNSENATLSGCGWNQEGIAFYALASD